MNQLFPQSSLGKNSVVIALHLKCNLKASKKIARFHLNVLKMCKNFCMLINWWFQNVAISSYCVTELQKVIELRKQLEVQNSLYRYMKNVSMEFVQRMSGSRQMSGLDQGSFQMLRASSVAGDKESIDTGIDLQKGRTPYLTLSNPFPSMVC